MLLLSFANESNSYSNNYYNSLLKQGYEKSDIHLIGIGLKWVNFIDTKIHTCFSYLAKLLKEKRITDNEVVCVTDCFDVLASGPPQELMNKYLTFQREDGIYPIVFGVESLCLGN